MTRPNPAKKSLSEKKIAIPSKIKNIPGKLTLNLFKRKLISQIHSWNLNQEFLLVIQTITSFFLLSLAWILQYWNSEGNPNLIGRISFRVDDPPWMPPGQQAIPILGQHYFGDWMITIGWALDENCYDLNEFACQVPPIGLWLLRLWNFIFINMQIGYFVWTTTAAFVYVFLILKYMKKSSVITKVNFFFIFILLAPGNLISLDRGSLHFMGFALLGLSHYLYHQGKGKYSLIIFLFCVSLKPQMAMVILILLKERKYKDFIKSIIIVVATNMVSLLFFSGVYLDNFKAFLAASGGYINSPLAFGNIMNSLSLTGLTSRLIEFTNGWESSRVILERYSGLLILPGLCYFFFVVGLILSKKTSYLVSYISVLSLISFVIPASSPYTLGWGSLAMLFVFSDKGIEIMQKLSPLEFFQVCIFSLIVISPGFVYYVNIPGLSRHIPLAVCLPLILLWMQLRELSKNKLRASEKPSGQRGIRN